MTEKVANKGATLGLPTPYFNDKFCIFARFFPYLSCFLETQGCMQPYFEEEKKCF